MKNCNIPNVWYANDMLMVLYICRKRRNFAPRNNEELKNSKIEELKNSKIEELKNSKIEELKNSKIEELKNSKIEELKY